jgi:hypothetical protein
MKFVFNNVFIIILALAILVVVAQKFNTYEGFALNRSSWNYYRLPNNFTGQRQYRKVPNAACTGRRIRDTGRMSDWNCQRACDRDPRCNCISKRKSDNMCRLETGTTANGRSYWVRRNWNALLPKNDSEYKKLPNRSCGGSMIKDVGRMNATRCQMQCNSDRKCRCISHRKSDNMCRLESGPNSNKNSSWNAYVPDKGTKIPYCPNKYYTEFNPSSCSYPDNPYWCSRTPKSGYYSTYSECRTKFSPDKDNYDNEDFFKLIHEAYELSTREKDGCIKSNHPGYNIYKTDDSSLVVSGKECRGKEQWQGYKDGINQCQSSCEKKGTKYFIYGNKRKDKYNRCKGNKCACYCEGPFPKKTETNYKLPRLKSLMNKVFRISCMLQANHDDYFEVKKCYSELQSYNSDIFYEKVREASKICSKNINADKFLCNKFKRQIKELTDLARIIRAENNSKSSGCYCSKALAAKGKCVPC